jgi:predicted ATPase
MAISSAMRRLDAKWKSGSGWPKRLEWLQIQNVRGWAGQRVDFSFPIMAITGENGAGKSTVLQCAAAVYRQPPSRRQHYPSGYLLETPWDRITNGEVKYSTKSGDVIAQNRIHKPGDRWRLNNKRPVRNVEYIDLSRIQPVTSRVGFLRIAKPQNREVSALPFDEQRLTRFKEVMGRDYEGTRFATTEADKKRQVPVVRHDGVDYSGFNQGAGETMVVELFKREFPETSLVIIDEIETSLHPRTQRRLMRDLAVLCREKNVQVILSTHSPYILDELPPSARAYIMCLPGGMREVVSGVSPEFAMTQMDEVPHPECELYVEDERARVMLIEILAARTPDLTRRCGIITYGAASVGRSLGEMVASGRFPRPSRVFLDGDQGETKGCLLLPGDDAPEQVVFGALKAKNWKGLDQRTGRPFSRVSTECERAMTHADHHEWVTHAATPLSLNEDILWQAMCAEWATSCLDTGVADALIEQITDTIAGIPAQAVKHVQAPLAAAASPERQRAESTTPKPAPRKRASLPAGRSLFGDK